jgi:hypothetical protein
MKLISLPEWIIINRLAFAMGTLGSALDSSLHDLLVVRVDEMYDASNKTIGLIPYKMSVRI